MAVSTLSFRSYIAKLSGRRLGAFKTAAAKLGIPFEEYVTEIEAGKKNCIDCRLWKDRGDFYPDSSRWDGVAAKCQKCSATRHKQAYIPPPVQDFGRPGPDPKPYTGTGEAESDRVKARELVNKEVAKGRRPDPNDLFCVKCGHKDSDRRHEYHHHMGYAPEHVFDVLPLCSACHHVVHDVVAGGPAVAAR
jgi:hypothetical protein